MASPPASSTLRALAARSVEVIADHQHASGAFVASPTFPVYRYSWLRDGAFIADAMSRAGRVDSADHFFGWCASVLNDRAGRVDDLVERATHGGPIGRDEHLPTRFTVDGDDSGEDWWDYQLDGYGTWIHALGAHLQRHQIQPAAEVLAAVGVSARYVGAFWGEPCYDWWEEDVGGVHVSTLAAIEAGLRTAGELLEKTALSRTAQSVRQKILDSGVIDGHLIKTIGYGDRVDASLIAAMVPFATIESTSSIGRATYQRVRDDLAPDGVYRYLGDTYFGGGRWVVLAGFVGAYEARVGLDEIAAERLAWMAAQADDDGLLPEQVATDPLDADYVQPWVERWGPIANPLLWSHAMYLTLADELGQLT